MNPNQPERPTTLRRQSNYEKVAFKPQYSKRAGSVRPSANRRNTVATGALTVNGSSARRLRTSSVAVEAASRQCEVAPIEAASEPSLSCFGALCSVIRAATDYCRYGNLRQYLLIDPNTGEPRQTFYSAGR